MQPLDGLFARLFNAHSLLSAICEATEHGSTYQLEYACAVGEWNERRARWHLNDLGISPAVVFKTVSAQLCHVNLSAAALGTLSFSGSGNCTSVAVPYPVRAVENPDPHGDHWPGFAFENAVGELRSRIGARKLAQWKQLPDELHNAYIGWFSLPQFATAECPGEQFPDTVEVFKTRPLFKAVRKARDVANSLVERLRQCFSNLGYPQLRQSTPTIEERIASHERDLKEVLTLARAEGNEPLETLARIGDGLSAVLRTECELPWATRYRRQCVRMRAHRNHLADQNASRTKPEALTHDLGARIDTLGRAALNSLAPTRLGDSVGCRELVEAVAVVQRLAGWSFFPTICTNPPDAVQLERAEREEASAVKCEKYLLECWLPARSKLFTMQEVVRGWHDVQRNTPGKRVSPFGKARGRKPRFSKAIVEQVKKLQDYRKPNADILSAVQNCDFDNANDRAAVARLTVADIGAIRDTIRKQIDRSKGRVKPRRTT